MLTVVGVLVVAASHTAEHHGFVSVMADLPVEHQKPAYLQTENGFYYSFYEDVVRAPSPPPRVLLAASFV